MDTISLAPGITLSPHARAIRTAAAQHNAINTSQLRSLRLTSRWVNGNVARGFLSRVDPRVYVIGLDPGDLPRDTVAMIGILRADGHAALGMESSMQRQGLWSRGGRDLHVVTTTRSSQVFDEFAPDVTLHSHRVSTLEQQDIVIVDGMPATTALRTIPELGMTLTTHQIAHVIWNAIYAECVALPELRARLDSMHRTPWTASARQAVALVLAGSCGTKSSSEDELLRIIELSGLPLPLVNVLGAAALPGVRLDFVWPELRVVFELDGRHHTALPGVAACDATVRAQLKRNGWTVLTAHYSRVWSDPIGIADRIGRAVGR